MYAIIPSENRDTLTSFFPVCNAFISYSFLIALSRTSSTILNRCEDHGQPCLVTDYNGIALNFSPLSLAI